eukprot:TRINITY_DN38671_c0_g1_i1.p1 TRINITY_DN38671_c0_g1~~TRINITY_DN38671_c0_g1_i1.p1  ORF type:complete len:565 (+),score=144.78 TRINITY_DN38671_c0_g1_i1:153-1847(+)
MEGLSSVGASCRGVSSGLILERLARRENASVVLLVPGGAATCRPSRQQEGLVLGNAFVGSGVQRLSVGIRRGRAAEPCHSQPCSVPRAALDPAPLAAWVAQASHNSALWTLAAADAAVQQATTQAAEALTATADSAASAVSAAAVDPAAFVKTQDWLTGLSDVLESALKLLEGGLTAVHVPYAYGFSIILLTLLVKAATYPLTKQQVESTMAMQRLQPKLKSIQAKYQGDQERIQMETARLYQQAGVNPLAGCLPTLATIPVWIGLYRALSNVAAEGILTEGFFWIPSLAGPTALADRASGSGVAWLFPFQDGAPPLGWGATAAYLVLPVLLVASQFFSMQLMQPPTTDPAQQQTQAILKFLPLLIGYFSLSVPSGLSLYWLTNNILSTAQQLYLKQYSAASLAAAGPATGAGQQSAEIIDAGQGRRSGVVATEEDKERERARGERFRALKEADAQRKSSARQAAEDAARAAAEKTEAERDRLLHREEGASSSSNGNGSSRSGAGEAEGEEGEEEDEHSAASKVSGGSLPAPVGGAPADDKVLAGKRSKRSRRSVGSTSSGRKG